LVDVDRSAIVDDLAIVSGAWRSLHHRVPA
jgi:hypothetical protein